MDVVGFGVNAIDQVIRLYRIPNANAKVVCPPSNYELFPGGVMGNTLTGLSRLGLQTGYIGKVGDDEYGQLIIKYAKDDKVDMSACQVESGSRTAWTWIVVDDKGERTITLFPNVLQDIDINFIQSNTEYISSARVLHLEASEMPLDTSIEAAIIARENGVKVSFDLDIPAFDLINKLHLCTIKELEKLISLSDYFIPCIGGAQQLSKTDDPLEITKYLQHRYSNKVVALSHGENGCYVATADDCFQSPAFPITAVDGTGSGDAFHAGMLYGLVQNWPIKKTAEFANACGAMNTVVLGARTGMASALKVNNFIKSYE